MGPGAGTLAPPAASRGEIEVLVETIGQEIDEIAATFADTVHEHLPELEEDMRPWTLQAARSNLGVIVSMMREGDDPGSVQPPPEAIGYTKEYVVRGLELSLMQRAYRTAQGVFGGIILERLRAATDDAERLAEAMAFFNAWIFAYVEAIERRLTVVYDSERDEWVRGAAAVRADEVRALLTGTGAVDATAVSLRLGYELDRIHVGFVVWSEEGGERPGDAGGLFAGMERGAGAVGTPAAGVDGFVLSHHEALLARRVAQLRGDGDGAVATYPDLALEALLAEDPDAARRFGARELGPLAAGDDATARLASTVAIFLEDGSSFVHAGRRLGIHANTVGYRIRRAESLLGRPLTERQLELRVALRFIPLGDRSSRV